MLSTSAQQLKEVGSSMGLKGADLLNFIWEQQKLEREERDTERQRQREERALEEKRKEKENNQRKKEEKAFMREKADSIPKLLQAQEEAKDRQRQHELEKNRLAFEQELERCKLRNNVKRRNVRDTEVNWRSMRGRCNLVREDMIPPPQIRFGVTHRETGDEAADYADAGGSRADC